METQILNVLSLKNEVEARHHGINTSVISTFLQRDGRQRQGNYPEAQGPASQEYIVQQKLERLQFHKARCTN